MKSSTGRRPHHALPRTSRRVGAAGAVLGVLAAVTVGFAPGASASDAQSKQWYLGPMQVEQMWKVSTGKGVKVAVLDTGVNADTPSLKGQVLTGETPASVAYHATRDYMGHGTTMAELIAGTGADGGLKGIAPGAKIVPYRILLDSLTDSAERKKTPSAEEAIRAAADTDVKIISMSFGAVAPTADEEAAIDYAASKGKLLIASAGNKGTSPGDTIGYPARYPYVVGVAAVDQASTVSKFSSSGGAVDLAAPGQGFPGWCDDTFRAYCDNRNGTSPAAAITSGSAALIWSAHPDWSVNQVTRALIDTAGRTWSKSNPSKYLGYGTIRPRLVLADSHYDAGAANVDPLGVENIGDLLAKSAGSAASAKGATPATPSSSASTPSQSAQKASTGGTAAAGSSAETRKDDSGTLWIVLGAAAAVIVVCGAGFAVMRARRTG
ncbi:S8 family serine peptidase [Streptomyces sp. J2-1]|uniref:S8 family serine peptidase n=1 Tax=Streptomyces corallincola TaxID=2851888 RepID=UPI001C38A130|nr:S8 family serine peptidase [Streptomyces corallincola]MBV2353572.1 S8 family serine peptidase [Streptomyces corallincola]